MKDRIVTFEQVPGEPIKIRVVCSICHQAFQPGERYYGQVRGVFNKYVPGGHLGQIFLVPASPPLAHEILDYFHERCVE